MNHRIAFAMVAVAWGAASQAADGVWTAGSGVWTNAAAWADGAVAGEGGTAAFAGAGGTVTVPGGHPFVLSSLVFNTNGVNVAWTVTGETNTLVSPAVVRVDTNTATLSTVLAGSDGFVKSGNGVLELTASSNLFSGKVTVSGGLLRIRADSLLGQVPGSLVADAITLNGGGLTDINEPLTLSANRGITVGSGNAWLLARFFVPVVIDGPITGPGRVTVARQSDAVVFGNPGNDYAGDTVLGSDDLGYWSDASAAGLLRLGADEVIPHGAGKGRLMFNGAKRGILDLNGKTETVNTVVASGDVCVSNSAAQPGVLKAGIDNANMSFGGEILSGATLEKSGAGKLVFADNGASRGGLSVTEGALDFAHGSSLGVLSVTLNGGVLNMKDTQPGLTESTLSSASATINPAVPMTETGVRLDTRKANSGATGFANNTQYGYSGEWYVPAAGTYSFAKGFDDGGYLAIDGNVLINNSVSSTNLVVRNVALTTGWHTLDVRVSQAAGTVGPRTTYGFTSGIMFDPANGYFTNAAEVAATARRFEDSGDGSSLRTLSLAGTTNAVRARLELAQSGTLDRSGTTAALVWSGDVVAATNAVGTPVLTVAGGAEPFRVGATNRPSVFGVDVDDPNGVVFQNKAWLKAVPETADWSIAAGAEITVGTPGLLGTGDKVLSEYSLRIPSADALGTGGETVTVGGSSLAVWFDATRESDGRLLDDSATAFTASNNVALSGTGARVGFDGAGTVTYAGSVSGSGTLVKNGSGDALLTAASTFAGGVQVNAGRLLVSDDAQLGNAANALTVAGGYLGNASGSNPTLARSVQVTSGGFDVRDASLSLSGVASGTAVKRGNGTLTLSGSVVNSVFDLYVQSGVAALGKSGAAAVRHITGVDTGAVVRLAGGGGNQIAGDVTLTGGTLDLNGFSESLGILAGTNPSNRVTNGGAGPSVLTVGESNMSWSVAGVLSDGAGALGLTKTGTGNLRLLGGATIQAFSGATRVDAGTLTVGATMRYVRFTVNQTRTAGQNPGIAEFQLTRDGEQVLLSTGVVVYATSQGSPTGGPERLIDNNAVTKWLAGAPSGQYFRLDLGRPTAFNGYRWHTANDAPERDPVAWTVEVSADNSTWYTVDARTAQAVTASRTMLAGEWALQLPHLGGLALSANSSLVVASNANALVYTMRESALSVAGLGTLSMAAGTDFAAGDISGFTGRITGEGRLLVGGAGGETVFSHLSSSPWQTLVNNGSAPLRVRLGGNTNASFTASVVDGTAPAGLVKRGASTVLLHGMASAYTGDTCVEEGTLAVLPAMQTSRFVRFTPTEMRGRDATYPITVSEFQLLFDGMVVAYPVGTIASSPGTDHTTYPPFRAVDGDVSAATSNRWISTSFPNALVIEMLQPVSFNGYRWLTGGTSNDPLRDPISWTVEVSEDGNTWRMVDVRVREPVADTRNLWVGPYDLGGRSVPQELWAVTNSLSEKLAAVTARYLRFSPTRMRNGAYDQTGTGFQISELQLLTNGAPVLYPAGTAVSAPGGGYTDGSQTLTPIKAVDNVVPTGGTNNRWYSQVTVNPLTVDMGQPVTFDAYRLYTGVNGAGRDPLSWTLEISSDSNKWTVVDVRTNWFGTLTRNALMGEWPLDLFARGGASACAIPDASRTTVASGATLKLDGAAAETVGPLSGTGTVALVSSAVFGINGFEDAVFAGAVTGTGTVAKTGSAVQTLSGALSFRGTLVADEGTLNLQGAVLTGVTNLVLRAGGTLAGAAAVSGDLTVTCEGGSTRANVAVSGALTVAGGLRLGLPAGAVLPYSQRLFAFGSADAATRASLVAAAGSLEVPHGFVAKVSVTSTAALLSVSAPGTLMMVR